MVASPSARRTLGFDRATRLLGGSVLALACSVDPNGRLQGPDPVSDAGMPPASQVSAPAQASCRPAAVRLWKLTPQQIERTVATLVPNITIDITGLEQAVPEGAGFSNAADWRDLSEPQVTQVLDFARNIAAQAATNVVALGPCAGEAPLSSACGRTIASDFGGRAFRRPLNDGELAAFSTFFDEQLAARGPALALRQLLRAIFMSPSFLFRSELGDPAAPAGSIPLAQHERASALSYFITNGPPDAELTQATLANSLSTQDQLREQAGRLLASPDLALGIRQLFDESLRVSRVLGRTKDPTAFPEWSPDLARDMMAETRGFVQYVLWHSQSQLGDLLTARYSFINERLARVYGISGVLGNDIRRVELPPERAGLLMHGSFLAAEAKASESDIVHRGLRVVRDWLCQTIPPPPPNAGMLPPPSAEPLTLRERIARHKTDPQCSGCHNIIDPVGYAFESFDAMGRYRASDLGKSIDTTGVLELQSGSVSFADARELSAQLAASPEVQKCLVDRVFTYALGRPPSEGDQCVVDQLQQDLQKSQGNIRHMLTELAANQVLSLRTK